MAEVTLENIYCDLQVQTLLIAIPGSGAPSPHSWKDQNDHDTWLRALDPNLELHLGIFAFPNFLSVEGQSISWQNVQVQGAAFLTALRSHIQVNKLSKFPIILVAHSTGGFILKRALAIAFHNSDRYSDILQNISIIMLLGCPHSHQKTADSWKVVSAMSQALQGAKAKQLISPDLAAGLGADCVDFERAVSQKQVISIYEGRPSKRPGFLKSKQVIVREDAVHIRSIPGRAISIDQDHLNLCHLPQSSVGFSLVAQDVLTATKALRDDIRLQSVSLHEQALPIPDQRSWIGPEDMEALVNSAEATAGSTTASFQVVPSLTDFSITKHNPKLPCHVIPYGRHHHFRGRATVLQDIWKALGPLFSDGPDSPASIESSFGSSTSEISVRTVALVGPGGMGKTQISIEFAHRHKIDFEAIFWIHADGPAKMSQSFTRIAIQLGLVSADSTEAQDETQTKEMVLGWLSKPYRSFDDLENHEAEEVPWLVIYDNVDDPDILSDSLPVGGSGSILITSRDPLLHPYLPSQSKVMDLQPLESKDATDLLLRLTGRHKTRTQDTTEDASSVAELLGGLPLAVAQIAGVITRDDLTFDEFRAMYEKEAQRQDLFGRKVVQKAEYGHNLASVWALEKLKHSRVLLDCLSLLDPDHIPESVLHTELVRDLRPGYPADTADYQRARTELLHSSLISREKEANTVRVHRLIQDTARSGMSPEEYSSTYSTTIFLLSQKWPYEEFSFGNQMSRWALLDELYPHVLQVQKHFSSLPDHSSFPPCLSSFHLHAPRLALDAAWHSIMQSRFEETLLLLDMGKQMCEALMTHRERHLPENKELNDVLEHQFRLCHHHRGVQALHTNQPDVSLPNLRKFTDLLRKKPGGDVAPGTDMSLGVAWNELGNAYLQNDDTAEAEACFLHSIDALRILDGADEYSISMPLINLGFAYWVGGKLDEALKTFAKALKDRENKLGVDDTDSFVTGKLLLGYGNVQNSLGHLPEAFTLHLRSLGQYRSTVGDNHHRTADACVKVAQYYASQPALYAKALGLLDQALRIWSTHSHFAPERARAHFRRGRLLAAMKKDREAEADLNDARELWKVMCPSDGRAFNQLGDEDFDGRIMFWSR